jgi:hypothetical protein
LQLRNKTAGVGGFDPKLLEYAFANRQPSSPAELLSGAALDIVPSKGFAGPIQFMLAEFDFLVCPGDCRGVADMPTLEALYPKATDIDVYIQEGTGHGLPYHLGANVGYKATYDFLAENGF